MQEDGSPGVKQVDTVSGADCPLGVSKTALQEVVAGWALQGAVPVTEPAEEVEQVVDALEKASAAVAGIAQRTEVSQAGRWAE